ncbi:DUF2280 domain-containing protein [Vibrio casei]|uniref:DUF2280 domain-containing protein n=1 Tax=Vibrio casei TaxID=673372 RepID=A0A368LIG8_9VIBR|nr:DUF2280 domain-containing protein [Vibrio casei]RCS70163.1 DUF2280 domain-containing protein [Vibrio casei]SJN24363.1 Phage protein [Vibrio casei]
MAALKNEVKSFIVQALACYDSLESVSASVKEQFGLALSRQQIQSYDPTKAAGKELSQKWIDLFNVTRERFQSEISDIPIANKAYRLRALNRMAMKTETMRNYNLTAQLIEQAAKECGDSYSNKKKLEHSGAGGGPIETLTLNKEEYKKARQEMLEDDDC